MTTGYVNNNQLSLSQSWYGVGNQVLTTGGANKAITSFTIPGLQAASDGTELGPFADYFDPTTGILTFPEELFNSIWRLRVMLSYSAGAIGGGGADNGVGNRLAGFDQVSWNSQDGPTSRITLASATDLTTVAYEWVGRVEQSSGAQSVKIVGWHNATVDRTIQQANSQLGSPQGKCNLSYERLAVWAPG